MPNSTPGKFARSWALFTSSFRVFQQNPRLWLFPIITGLCTCVIMLFFLSPAMFYPSGYSLTQGEHWVTLVNTLGFRPGENEPMHPNAFVYGYGAIIYLVSMFVATFANVAFYHEIMKALAGEAVSLRAGFSFAMSRILPILTWSLFAGLVGIIIKNLEQRFGWIGQFVMRFVGVVWSVASVFAIPVIIRENDANPVRMLRNSASTLRKTWGEALIGYIGINIGTWIVVLASFLFLGAIMALGVTLHAAIIAVGFICWLCAVIAYSFIIGMVGHVYRCALYIYASEGVVPAPYSEDMMDAAWKVK